LALAAPSIPPLEARPMVIWVAGTELEKELPPKLQL
jgi:hypothetical protein